MIETANRQPSNDDFILGFSADLVLADGSPIFGDVADRYLATYPHVRTHWMQEHLPEISAKQLRPLHAAIVGGGRVTTQSLEGCEHLLAIARLGVGYDRVDIEACTDADVLVTITAGAVDRSMAEATLTWMLALSHNLRIKDQLVRTGQWAQGAMHHGVELRSRTLGLVGVGRIAQQLLELLRSFGMNPPIAFDPYLDPAKAASVGVKLVTLDEVMAQADFVSVHCPLTPQTRNLIGAEQIALMKPTAYLINTARGGIVDETALCRALKENRIAGAALDCFDEEPLPGPPPLSEFDNALMAPHCIGWTHEMFRDMAEMACQTVVDLAQGKAPHGMLNPQVLERPGFIHKWQRWGSPAKK
jgi:phosphoglycerate dehydrogenase-like enzyme